MSNFRVAELDFDSIKENLKAFLSNYRDKDNNLIFSDYDFDASSLSILLDILAYNTHYNAYLANMAANELFLDSAVKRQSAVSVAKHLGYTPNSTRSARAVLTFEILNPVDSPATLTLPRFTPFTTAILGKKFTFVNLDPVTILPSGGRYLFSDVEIVEGEPLSYTQRVDTGLPFEKYVIPNKNIDTSTIRVRVQNSFTDPTSFTYTFADNLASLTPESRVYFLEENAAGYYQIYFGDGVLSRKLEPRNLVNIEYLISAGSQTNVASDFIQTFTLENKIAGGTVSGTITATSNSTGGDEADTIEEIRFKAPRFISAFNRAVTSEDYKSLIESNFPLIESVAVWGGEDNDPPKYGKVMISLKPFAGYLVNDLVRSDITNKILANRKMLTTIVEFVEPNYLHINFTNRVRFDPTNSVYTSQDIQQLVEGKIKEYFELELQKFDRDFVYSQLTREIDNIDESIIGNTFSFKLQKRIVPIIGARNSYSGTNTIKFSNKLVSGSVQSTTFFYLDAANVLKLVYMADILTKENTAQLNIHDFYTDEIVYSNIGTVTYDTGIISIPELVVRGFQENSSDIRIYARSQDLDINATRDVILLIDDSKQDVLLKRESGITIQVVN
jgi:hypothetical protein